MIISVGYLRPRGHAGRLDNSLENLERVVREVCAADVEPDGMVFDAATVKTERIKAVRTKLRGALSRCTSGECTILAQVARVQTSRARPAKR